MEGSIAGEAVIKEKSQELEIPYAHAAAAFAIEKFLAAFEKTEYGEGLWLKNAGSLNAEHYRRRLVLELEFYYQRAFLKKLKPAAENGEDDIWIQKMLERICPAQGEIIWNYEIQKSENAYKILLNAGIGVMQVPLTVRLEPVENEKINPYPISLQLTLQKGVSLNLLQYPMEYIAADCMCEILEKLELLNDMSMYQKLYTILKEESLDGRKMQQQLLLKSAERKIRFDEQRMKLLESYRDYTYMKKKWKAYLKRENRQQPEWEEVVDAVKKLMDPIYQTTAQDMIFIGDWMPEIMRYLA